MDDANDMLPKFSGPADHLRCGFRSFEKDFSAPHPVAAIQKNDVDWSLKMDMVRRTYGSHMAMRLATDKQLMKRAHRLPGLQSSSILFDTISGNDTKIEFSDFLNDPSSRADIPKVKLHTMMEVKLGLI